MNENMVFVRKKPYMSHQKRTFFKIACEKIYLHVFYLHLLNLLPFLEYKIVIAD